MEDVVINTHKEELKKLLADQLNDCKLTIQKRKRKIKIIKIAFYSLIGTATVGSSVVILLSSFFAPSIVIGVLSTVVTLSTVLSIKFNLESKMQKLGQNIQSLNGIKNRLAYLKACNGNLTEHEYKIILESLQSLYI